MFFPFLVATLLLCAPAQISGMDDAASTSTASTDFNESAIQSDLIIRLGLIRSDVTAGYNSDRSLKAPLLNNVIGHRLEIEAAGTYTYRDGEPLTPLKKAASKEPYANFLLAVYALTGKYGSATPDIKGNWYPSEISSEDHPIRRLQRLTMPTAEPSHQVLPEAAYFLLELYKRVNKESHDLWIRSHRPSCEALINGCDEACKVAGFEAEWTQEKRTLASLAENYIALRETLAKGSLK